jgi:NADH-quinone oxidoreductase subunit H
MSMAVVTWQRLNVVGKILAFAVPILLALGLVSVGAILLAGPFAVGFVGDNVPLVRFVAAVTAVLVLTIPTAFIVIFLELKVIARMNLRIGPERVGPYGGAQSVVHGLKVLAKEDFTPLGVDVTVFTLAPLVTFVGAVMTMLVIPFAPGLFGLDLNIGVLYLFAMSGLTVVGLLMAGWSSFNKYSLLGGLRSAAQMVSYEIPLTLSLVGIVLIAGTMSLNQLVLGQSGSFLDWNVWKQPLGFLIFFIAGTAEANRTPFDLTEADSELVGGFATEYSGMRFGFFFFAEYVNVFIMSALLVTFFLGGWTAPFAWPFAVTIPTLDPLGLGIGLLIGLTLVPVVGTLILAAPFWLSSRITTLQALVIGFILFNVIAVGLVLGYAFVSFDWIVGLFWFFAKAYVFVFLFIWMRATLPRVRIDQLMGFAWKWLLPAALLNIFVTAAAVAILAR